MKHFVLVFLTLVCIALVSSQGVPARSPSDYGMLEGFWEGEFMPGNDLTLVLIFRNQGDGAMSGRILLFQGDVQIQDDLLQNISVVDGQLSFFVEAKSTPFDGRLGPAGREISGQFRFPDGSLHRLLVKKVVRPSRGDASLSSPACDIFEKKYSIRELREDFNFLRHQLEITHPQLYLYSSKEEFDGLFDRTLRSIKTEMTEDTFFRLIAPVVANVNCCHTGIRPSREFSNALNNRGKLLPLEISFIDGKAFIIMNFGENSDIIPGMQVLSINNMRASEILRQLLARIPSDGFNESSKLHQINHGFSQVFSLYIGNYAEFELECLASDGREVHFQLQGLSPEMLSEAIRHANHEGTAAGEFPLRLSVRENPRAAILSVHAFGAPDPDQYRAFLQASFRRLNSESIPSLIIDLRGNGGGHPLLAAELLSYLAKSSFTYFELPEGRGELAPLYEPLEPKEERFTGDVYILIDGGCLSSSGHFLSLVKYHGLATLIGQESGSSFYCNDQSRKISLPNTKIEMNLPQTTFQTAVKGFRRGEQLLPDYFVKPELDDLLKGRDVELAFALQLIERNCLNKS